MPVSEMLSRTSSYELSEWQAFEHAFGPLGSRYSDDVLAALHEQVQLLNHMTGALVWGEDNNVPTPSPVLRPDEVFKEWQTTTDDGQSVAEFVSQFD